MTDIDWPVVVAADYSGVEYCEAVPIEPDHIADPGKKVHEMIQLLNIFAPLGPMQEMHFLINETHGGGL